MPTRTDVPGKGAGLGVFLSVMDRQHVQEAEAAGEAAVVNLRRQLARADRVTAYQARAKLCALTLARQLAVLERNIRAEAEQASGREERRLRRVADDIAAGRMTLYQRAGVA